MKRGTKFLSMTKDDVKRITQLKDQYTILSNKRGIGYKRQAREIRKTLLNEYDLII